MAMKSRLLGSSSGDEDGPLAAQYTHLSHIHIRILCSSLMLPGIQDLLLMLGREMCNQITCMVSNSSENSCS